MGWQAVFDENFDGASVDRSAWDVQDNDGFTSNGINTRDTVSVEDGNAVLRTYTDSLGATHTSHLQTGGNGVKSPTWGGFDSAYGYIETRMNLPDGPDTKSAFWLMSQNGNNSLPFGDPASDGPEIDIIEHDNEPNDGEQYRANGHWDGLGWQPDGEEHVAMTDEAVVNPDSSAPLQGNFHTYGLLWTPEEYRFYLDGQEVKHVTAGVTFNPEWLILSTYAYGRTNHGPLGGPANDVTLVDYVKVWQRPISDVPDQSTAANEPLAVPFTVQDYFYGSPAKSEPGAVTVSADSSNTSVVPNGGLAVSGNGPDDPDGSFNNGGFESGLAGWAPSGSAAVWSTKKHSGAQALRLTQEGGTATQTISGLRPNTTYLVGGHYEIDIGFDDKNGNGRVDKDAAGTCEPFTEPGDGTAAFDWGITDVDTAKSGHQEIRTTYNRNGWTECTDPPAWMHEAWPHEVVKFTTGPTTTSVALFVDNTKYVNQQADSDITIDDIYVRPLVSPQRTLSIRPAAGAIGDTTITLTAENARGTTIGTDRFVLTVGAGSLRDGSFEIGVATTPWERGSGSPQLVSSSPFQVDRQYQLAATANDTMIQRVTSLMPNTRYRLEVSGRNANPEGELGISVQNYGGPALNDKLTGTTTTSRSIEFVTGASNTGADVIVLDWVPADGASFVQKVSLSPCASVTSCATLATTVPSTSPPSLADIGTRHGVSGIPLNIAASLPAGATLTSITSTDEMLIPNTNIATSGGRQRVFTLTPVQDHTGITSIRVSYSGAAGSPVDIPVVISHAALLQPGFEKGAEHWKTSGTASVTTSEQHSGNKAMQINGEGEISQSVPGLPHAKGYTLRGWVTGSATVMLKTVPTEADEQSEVLATANWTGSGWTQRGLAFTTIQCTSCTPEEWRPVQIVLTDTDPSDGQPVSIDDLALIHEPVIRKMRDISLHSQQTTFEWTTMRIAYTGRVSPNAIWETDVVSMTSSDIPGFGAGVVPLGNVQGPQLSWSGWPYYWQFDHRAGGETGRSKIAMTLTDPATGFKMTRSWAVTVNAGSNFNNGDFERSSLSDSGVNGGWTALPNSNANINKQQTWQYLGIHSSAWEYVGPVDMNKVLRISAGGVKYKIDGLAPNTSYTVKLRAKGNGSGLRVRTRDDASAPIRGQLDIVPLSTTNEWRDYEFTFTTTTSGEGSTGVSLFIVDDTPSDKSSRPCARFAAGETCLDDIGIFKTADLQ